MNEESEFTSHEACPSCHSSDALARYTDGHGYCFSCGHYQRANGDMGTTSVPSVGEDRLSLEGLVQSLPKRSIREDTAQLFGYRQGEYNGRAAHYAYYFDPDTRRPIAAKVRFPDKSFTFIGDAKKAPLYGQWLWRDGGKMVVVTEGEIDALSVSQAQGNKWPVVSVQNGAQGAVKSIKKALDWLSKFDEVILMFDMDEHGRKAALECAELFEPGKCKIASLPLKDASDMLQANRTKELIDAVWGAKTYRPDGVVDGSDLWQAVLTDDATISVSYPWAVLNDKTHGIRRGELVTVTAGSGVGKSAIVREIAYHLITLGETIGMIMLEESTKRTALGLMGIHMNKPLHLGRDGISEEQLKESFKATVGSGQVFLYDHFGSTEVENLLAKIRYMARSLDCRWIILDHLSIVVSGLDDGGDERKLIDKAMTMLRTLVQETGIGLILVSHLRRPEGKGHEEGAKTSLSQLRGSHSIAQLSDMVLGAERDQQGDNPNVTVIRVLKNRFSGETGEACSLYYSNDTGRLTEAPPVDDEFADEAPF